MDGNKQMVKNEKTFSDFSSPIPSSTLPSWRTMPPRGRTRRPWWTHFQSVEGCTYVKDSFYSESLGDFRLAKCLHCDKLVRRGKPGCTARETTRGWHRTWGPSTVDLLSRWCSSLNFVVQLPTPYPQPLKTTLGFPLNSTNAWGLQLWIKSPQFCVNMKRKRGSQTLRGKLFCKLSADTLLRHQVLPM